MEQIDEKYFVGDRVLDFCDIGFKEASQILASLPNDLLELHCTGNDLTVLPPLPNSLKVLNISVNKITKLPKLPPNLEILDCYENNLKQLPDNLPDSLVGLQCSDNKLTQLPPLPLQLKDLGCSKNKLKDLPLLPDSVKRFVETEGNPFTKKAKKDLTSEDKEKIKAYCSNDAIKIREYQNNHS
jgi:Leucine-rich repeat (LRR) protein